MKFNCIICDPPWSFDDRLSAMRARTKRSAASNYGTLSSSDIRGLDVGSLADPAACVLALWCPSTLLDVGLDVLHAWGFKLKQTLVWVKMKKDFSEEDDLNNATGFGMGRLFRQAHELALIGAVGDSVYSSLENRSQRSVIFAPNEGHSTKPPHLHERLEKMFPHAEKLEMFARRARPGWTCIGDAIDGKDVREALAELKEKK